MSNSLNSEGFLLSYPRSGNTWVRYIVEFISKRSTIGYSPDHPADASLGKRKDLGVDFSQPPILTKSHCLSDEQKKCKLKLICLVRNYKEVLLRHRSELIEQFKKENKSGFEKELFSLLKNDLQGQRSNDIDYIKILYTYDNWKYDKLLIYYEDLIENTEIEIKRIVNFLQLSEANMKLLLDDIKEHKKNSLSVYSSKTETNGKSTKFHSKKVSKEFLMNMDEFIIKQYPYLFEKYLSRFLEA